MEQIKERRQLVADLVPGNDTIHHAVFQQKL